MNTYEKRGRGDLGAGIILGAVGILSISVGKVAYGAVMLTYALVALIKYRIIRKKQTPEEFEQKEKEFRMRCDERSQMIDGRACAYALIAVIIFAVAGLLLGYLMDNDALIWMSLGLLLVIFLTLEISRAILNKKL